MKTTTPAIRPPSSALRWLAALLLLWQCTTLPAYANDETEAEEDPSAALATRTPEAAKRYESLLPQIELDATLLRRFLLAEFAALRGDWKTAYDSYLKDAKRFKDPRMAQRASNIAADANQLDDAITANRLWISLLPKDKGIAWYLNQANENLLRLLLTTGALDKALPLMKKRLQGEVFQPDQALPYWLRTILSATPRDKSLAFLKEVFLPQYQNVLAIRLAIVSFALSSPNADIASEVQALSQDFPQSERVISIALYALPLDDNLKTLAETFLKTNPKANKVRALFAQKLLENKDYRNARIHYQTLLENDSDNLETLRLLGMFSVEQGDYKSAEVFFRRYLETGNTQLNQEQQLEARSFLAESLTQQKRYAEAADALTEIPNQFDHFKEILFRAKLLTRSGRSAIVMREINAIPAANKKEAKAKLLAKVVILRMERKFLEAFNILNKEGSEFQDDLDVQYELAISAEQVDNFSLTEEILRQIIRDAPDDYRGYNGLGYLLADRNQRLPEARTLLETALHLSKQTPAVVDSWGWLLFREGNITEAITFLRKAYNDMPDTEIALHLGEALWRKGEKKEATELFKKIKINDDEMEMVERVLKRLGVNVND